jgi:hemolysin III
LHPLARPQSPGEELANSISHGLALAAALALGPWLVVDAAARGDAGYIAGVAVFVTSLIVLYLSSTLYHALPGGRAKNVFRVIEHAAIYLLIAGTYTPFTLGVLRGPWGWTLLGVVWGLALVGVLLKALDRVTHPIASTALYLLMGWLIIVAIEPLSSRMPAAGLAWLVAGGLAYTIGTAFFATDHRLRYGHFVWHLFVITGSVCHGVAIYRYAV